MSVLIRMFTQRMELQSRAMENHRVGGRHFKCRAPRVALFFTSIRSSRNAFETLPRPMRVPRVFQIAISVRATGFERFGIESMTSHRFLGTIIHGFGL